MATNDAWIKLPEAARIMGISEATLRKAVAEGTLENVPTLKVRETTLFFRPSLRPGEPTETRKTYETME